MDNTFDVLHADVYCELCLNDLVQLDNVRMVKGLHQVNLSSQSQQDISLVRLFVNDLDRVLFFYCHINKSR